MISGLESFVAELRREGIAASPGEWLDAVRALERIGVADRERFRLALRCTLVKRAAWRPTFDRVFDQFFAAPARSPGRERSGGGAGRAGSLRPSDSDRSGLGLRPAESPGRRPARIAVVPRHEHEPIEKPRLQRLVRAAREGGPERRGRLRNVLLEPRSDRGARGIAHPRAGGQTPPLLRDLRRSLSIDEEREIANQVPRLVQQIRLGTGRRVRRASRGRLYLRRVFRDNLRNEGIPWLLPRRRRRPRRPRVVLLIDVSWSTARAAGLFLALGAEFLRRAADTRVLLFVDRAVDATAEIEGWLGRSEFSLGEPAPISSIGLQPRPGAGTVRRGLSFAQLLESLPQLNLAAPSDYGRAFDGLLRSRFCPAGRRTVLVVLGDGRTNRLAPQEWAFEEIAERCGVVLWLVPEALAEWGTGDSALGTYLPHADVAVETRDLAGLARGLAELLRRL